MPKKIKPNGERGNLKKRGAFYTPIKIAEWVSLRVGKHMETKQNINILEPSAGDGSFIKPIQNIFNQNVKIDAVEIDRESFDELSEKFKGIHLVCHDFLFWNPEKYDLIIGNPPYINKKLLTQEQIAKCLEIHNNSNIPTTSISNIWTAFLLKSAQHLKNKGILTFVLPTELLQVNYAEKIRKFLRKEFNRIEIILFKKLSFSDIEQDTVILIAYKNYDLESGLFFSEVDSIRQLNDSKINFNKYTNHVDRKWTSYVLSENEIKYLDSVSKDCKKISDVCSSKTGIVTAANSFFIVNKETVIEYDMQKYVKPIIQKSSYLDKSVEITLDYINKANQKNKPTYLIDLNGVPDKQIPLKLKQYLENGVSSGVSRRYKCLKRKRWFDIPLIESSEAIFYKRAHEFPKILNNVHGLYTTDSGYRIYMKDDYSVEQLLFGFYNSLTLLHSEINGRYYGGGVLELVPSEFKSLPVIIDNISTEEYDNFKVLFESAKSIEDFLYKHDYNILPRIGLKNEEIQKIQVMYAKIKFKRLNKNK